jgi:MFS family permease
MTAPAGRGGPARPRTVLALLLAANLLNFFDRQIPAVVAEPLRQEWNLSDAALGWLGTAFILVYACVGLPLGRISDLHPRRRILSAGLAVWSLFTALSALSRGFWSFFAMRMGVGIGEASCAPAATSLIGDLFPPERRGRALSVFMLGLPAGLALSYVVSGTLAAQYGWRCAFLLPAIPGLAIAIALMTIQEPSRRSPGKPDHGHIRHRAFRIVLRTTTMRWIIASGALHNFMLYALSYFLTAFLMRYHASGLRAAGVISGLITGILGGAGMLAGGWLADAAFRRWKHGRLAAAALAVALGIPAFLLAADQPPGAVAAFSLWFGLAWLLMYIYYAGIYATIQDVLDPSLRATGMSLYFFAMYLLGAALGPVSMGWLSDMLARRAAGGSAAALEPFRAAGLHQAFQVVPLAGVLLAACLVLACRSVSADMDRVTQKGERTMAPAIQASAGR